MNIHELVADLREDNGSKIVLLVADGLGGLPLRPGGKTELETARTPNLDACVREGVCGLSLPVLPGITPGSGPGHLGLFGYDPLEYRIGRGILEALGINFKVGDRDVAVRGNFVTLENGVIKDRRASRPSTDRCKAMVEKMRQVKIPGVEDVHADEPSEALVHWVDGDRGRPQAVDLRHGLDFWVAGEPAERAAVRRGVVLQDAVDLGDELVGHGRGLL